MAVPPPDAPCWQRLASGGLSRIRTDNMGVQMMAKRFERSSEPLSDKARELHFFFSKWEGGLKNEIAQFAGI